MAKNLVFDIETDGLLLECTKMHLLTAYSLDTKEVFEYREGDLGWMQLFDNASMCAGHNILGFDVFALEKLFEYKFKPHVMLRDTLILSQVMDYKRFGALGHGLKVWGEALDFPKYDFNDWTKYSEEMRVYCLQDVMLTVRVYEIVMREYQTLYAKKPTIKHYIQAEHAAAKWCTMAQLHGWPFDLEAAKVLYNQLEEKIADAHTALNARLGTKTVPYDRVKGEVETKRPKWTKEGAYDAHTCNWFNVHKYTGLEGEERMIEGPYSRVVFEPLSLDSVADVKVFLYRNGWTPTEWNIKTDPITRKKVRTSPKITEDSLEFLGGDGKLYTEFLTAKSRHSILKTWIANTDSKGNLHGDCMAIGTPSMRARHSIIVNVPSTDSPWGSEMRSLFRALPGWSLVGCDSSGNQARGLAHYLADPSFIDTLLNGDIHQYNADILTVIVTDMRWAHMKKSKTSVIPEGFVVKRSQAKRILYAFLFGASGAKLWSYIFGILDETNGPVLKKAFIKAVPGFKVLLDKLEGIFAATNEDGNGYLPSLAGNKIYTDSKHKLLVYLLQAAEKITCATALMYTVQKLEEEKIPYIPCIFYHDEIDFMVPDEYAQRAAEIGKAGFKEGPKLYGVMIMDGDAKVGKTWYDVH